MNANESITFRLLDATRFAIFRGRCTCNASSVYHYVVNVNINILPIAKQNTRITF